MAGKDCFVVLAGDNFNYHYTGPGVVHIYLSNNQHLEDTADEKPSTNLNSLENCYVPETKNDEHFDADDRKDLIANVGYNDSKNLQTQQKATLPCKKLDKKNRLDPLTVISQIEIEQDSVTEDSEFFGNTDNTNSQIPILRRSKRIQEQRRNQEFKKKQTEVVEQNSKSKKKGGKKSKVKNNTRKNPTASTSGMISERNSENCENAKERKKIMKKNNTRKYKEPFYFASTSITRAFESVPESIVRINNEDGETIVTFKMRDREDLVEIPEENLTQNMREMLIAYYDNHARRLREGFVYFEEAKNNVGDTEAIMQVVFAENYSAVSQNEIQNAHWTHPQIAIFTCFASLKVVYFTPKVSYDAKYGATIFPPALSWETPEAGTSAEDNHIAVDPRIPNTKLEKRSTVGYKEKQLSIFNNSEHFKTRNCSLETKVGI